MEALPGFWSLTPIGGMLGMLAILYWLLATGRLVTKSSHEREIGILNTIVSRQDTTIEVQQDQIQSLTEVGKTMEAVLKSAGPPVAAPTGSK